MLRVFHRKARQVLGDPVLRRWLLWRLCRRAGGPAPFTPHRPPYLDDLTVEAEAAATPFAAASIPAPAGPLRPLLPGADIALNSGDDAFAPRADGEVESAFHRFAWVPLAGAAVDHGWVAALWRQWRTRFADKDGAARQLDGPAWEAYTAAERAINLLDYADRHGFPGDAGDGARVLAGHVAAILARLEYDGEHATHNHLANNGRGLLRLGLALGMPRAAALGARILEREADRLILPSGALREESSHYQLLYVRNYADCWLAARRHGHPAEAALLAVLRRLWAVVPRLVLPGGLALVGDISPDSPPDFLAGLLPGGDLASGWTGLLPDEARQALAAVRDAVAPVALDTLAADGWVRADAGGWSLLTHVPAAGWNFVPGHGHAHCGGFELHHRGVAVVVDPGRGRYGETGEAAFYRSAAAHSGLLVDGEAAFPTNKPYYTDAFRRAVGGAPPRLEGSAGAVALTHHGFGRLGCGSHQRHWTWDADALIVEDSLDGRGRHRLQRRLWTTLPVGVDGTTIRLGEGLRLETDAPVRLETGWRWSAYGRGEPATCIIVETQSGLPWRGRLRFLFVKEA